MLASSGRPQDLADAIEPLLLSGEQRAQIGRAGRERFLQEYTTAAMRRRFFARLAEVVPPPR
jgi:spore maturation protein CgeB